MEVTINFVEKRKYKNPMLLVGLPGVGSVALLAADHLITALNGVKVAEIYSHHFPARVLVEEKGLVRLVRNEVYCINTPKRDVLLLTGESQAQSQEGQYVLAESVVGLARDLGIGRIITIGGYAIARSVEFPRVIGAATSEEIIEEFSKLGVEFGNGEPGGGIVGASGVILGVGSLDGLEGLCLMGETSGYVPDPQAAKKVLEILSVHLSIDMDYTDLDAKAKQVELIEAQLRSTAQKEARDETLRYIG